jgi:hypothetical protein
MKLKVIEVNGASYAEVKDGKPVYVGDDNNETTYDPVAMHQTINRLNGEAKGHREAKEAAEKMIKEFEGVDPAAARKALETLSGLDQKKLIDAGEVDKVKSEISRTYEEKLKAANERAQKLENDYAQEKTSGAFASSKFVKEKLAIPADMVQATFGRHFQFKEGKLSPIDQNGNPIYSNANPGEVANFDEAMEIIVSKYPHRDSILRGTGNQGSGAQPPGEGGKRIITRDQFTKLNPQDQAKYAGEAAKGTITITD